VREPARAAACALLRPDLPARVVDQCLNPKVALFFLAFVPQFIAPDAPQKALAFVVLGCIFNLNGMIWCHLLAFPLMRAKICLGWVGRCSTV
jgi:threonine/homoserine/homoserine lactone efflux protein